MQPFRNPSDWFVLILFSGSAAAFLIEALT